MKLGIGLIGVAVLSLLSAGIIFGQEAATEPDMQWAWGEVVSVDSANKTITVKSLDYETDQEKEISVTIDEKTTFENVKSLDEIKALDAISIDYTIDADGKKIAKAVTIEAPMDKEAAQEESAAPTFTPAVPTETIDKVESEE